jgi:hypothetical protein
MLQTEKRGRCITDTKVRLWAGRPRFMDVMACIGLILIISLFSWCDGAMNSEVFVLTCFSRCCFRLRSVVTRRSALNEDTSPIMASRTITVVLVRQVL